MNKGVKFLLKRKETHPKEFCSMGRWTSLLIAFEAYPLDKEHNPKNPREFNRQVMHRLLTGSDLEEPKITTKLTGTQLLMAKRMGITPADYAKALANLERSK
jgi:dsDNA-specific endonuclease/ATPase MutS2